MANPIHKTVDFLRNIDEDLVQYETLLVEMGFTSTRSLRYLLSADIISLPKAHSRLLMANIQKLLTPKSTVTSDKSSAVNRLLKPKQLFDSQNEEDSVDFLDEYTFYKYESPIEKEIGEQELKLEAKSSEIKSVQTKIKELEKTFTSASSDDHAVGMICSNCHVRGNHKSTNCFSEKCVTR
jgi:hypothetical protein